MRTGTTARSIAVTGAALLALTACGGGDEGGDTTNAGGDTGSGEKQVNVYGTDGNMGNALGESFTDEGALAGMKGTTPLTDLGDEFTNRLTEIDPDLKDFNYAGETYDAIMIAAIGAQLAGSTDPAVFAPYINGVTFGGDTCTDFASCKEIVDGGGNPDYDGVSGPLAFAEAGEPSVASFGILQFGPDNAISDDTQFELAGDESNAASDEGPAPAAPGATATDPLVVGTLLPQTGDLAFLGPPEIAGAELAVQEINAAGGVLGQPVQLIQRDSGDTSTDIATQSVDALLQQNVDVIVGAASSAVTRTVIDKITGAGVVQISPANTSDEFTDYDDNGLYFRTAPPDTLQARALADLIIEDGANTVGILARNDSYGTGLAENTVANLQSSGLAEDAIELVVYDPTAANFDAEVQEMVDLNPDAIVVIGFEESAKIIDGLNAEGIGPKR